MNFKSIYYASFFIFSVFYGHLSASERCYSVDSGVFNGKNVWKSGMAVGFISKKLAVDADGAPNSYKIDGKGLSYTCDGVTAIGSTPDTDPVHWEEKCNAGWAIARKTGDYTKLRIFGFLTGANNIPVVQREGDPLPDLGFISTTTVTVPDGPEGTQRHWVDATKIPYIVLPQSFVKKFQVSPGDVAIVYRISTKKIAFGVYGDGGKLGEASVKLHLDIGGKPIVLKKGISRAKRGIEDDTLTVVFPGKKTNPTVDSSAWNDQIREVASKVFTEWGGLSKIEDCLKYSKN